MATAHHPPTRVISAADALAAVDALPESAGRLRDGLSGHLSLSFVSTADYSVLPDLVRSGVASLKIEGRLKSPEYVASITRVYRQALDKVMTEVFGPAHLPENTVMDDVRRQSLYDLEMGFSRGLYTGWFRGIQNQELAHARFGTKRGVYLGQSGEQFGLHRVHHLTRWSGHRRREADDGSGPGLLQEYVVDAHRDDVHRVVVVHGLQSGFEAQRSQVGRALAALREDPHRAAGPVEQSSAGLQTLAAALRTAAVQRQRADPAEERQPRQIA